MIRSDLNNIEIPGEVLDVSDPFKKGRVRVRVTSVYDKLDIDTIPWASPLKDPHGKSFKKPEIGQIVNVRFEDGDWYRPFYSSAEHHNINLQKKLEELDTDSYNDFSALHFDDRLQFYRDSNKAVLDFDLSNITLDKSGNISMNLRDNGSFLLLGSPDATQEAMLGTHWIEWFDSLVQVMFKPYLGNAGAPVVPTPEMINVLNQYYAMKSQFLSKHVFIVDNQMVKSQERINEKIKGDKWKSTIKENDLTFTYAEPYVPEPRPASSVPEIADLNGLPPADFEMIETEGNPSIEKPVSGKHENGKIPLDKLKASVYLSKHLASPSNHLVAEAADAFDKMMAAYDAATFKGKQKITFTDGYRTYEGQIETKRKHGSGAAGRWQVNGKDQPHNYVPKGIPGEYFKATSNHGWGLAVDMSWGIKIKYRKDPYVAEREAAFRHPVYRWFFVNGPKYGWYNPESLRDGSGVDEWWHWEYKGVPGTQVVTYDKYAIPWDFERDHNTLFVQHTDNTWKAIT